METKLTGWDTGIVALYFLAMLGLGAFMARRIRGFKEYFLAGGALTTPILVCTLVSSYYGLDVTLGVSESAFHYGIVSWVWLSRPYYLAIILAVLLVAPRLKRHSFMTLPDLLDHYYGTKTRIAGALACFIYNIPIIGLAGMVVLFETLGIAPGWGLLLVVCVCAAYTMLGGLWVDAISDSVQFVLMCVSLAVALPLALHWVGGFDFVQQLPREHLTQTGGLSRWLLIAWSLGALTVFVEPAFYQRIFAARDSRSIVRAMILGLFLWAAYDWGVTLLGMVARAAVDSGMLDAGTEGKQALLVVCIEVLPTGLRGLFLGGVLAAAMSTIDTYSLLASGNVVYDIYRPLRNRPLSERALVRSTRLGVLGVMAAGVIISLWFDRVTDAWIFMSSVLASVVFVPTMGALFGKPSPRAGWWGSVAGLAGLATFYTLVHWHGTYDEDAESWVWRIGTAELWREFAVLFALPLSGIGFALGHWTGRKEKQ